jgi:hypothetical protein
MDDFAVVWTDHVNEPLHHHPDEAIPGEGELESTTKYLGMNICINRERRYVTLTIPEYIDKLLARVRPNGIKGATTPAQYTPPNHTNSQSQKATVDTSPLASEADKKMLRSMVGTLLYYYSRAVDPSICTAVHELGTVQSKPTLNNMHKYDRLLQYVSINLQKHGHQILRIQYDLAKHIGRFLP